MKRLTIFCILMFFVISFAFADVNVQKTSPERIEINQPFEVTIQIYLSDASTLDFSEMLPQGWEIQEWNVIGAEYNSEKETKVFMGRTREIYLWTFRDLNTEQITITYTAIPEQTGNFDLISLWITPENFETSSANIFVVEEGVIIDEPEKFNFMWIIVPIIIAVLALFFVYFKFLKPPEKNYNDEENKIYKTEWDRNV